MNMKYSLVICDTYMTVKIQNHHQARHVYNIKIIGTNTLLVNGMGNLWVNLTLPVPVPMKTCTRTTGTGFSAGQTY
jgi:hypothetical protein